MTTSPESDPEFENLLEYLKRARGFDFTGYKRASVMRRVNKRMQERGIASYLDYIDYLEVHPREFASLFNTILINVTAFFRDTESWRHLAAEVLPDLLSARPKEAPIRVFGAFGMQDLGTLTEHVLPLRPDRVLRKLDPEALGLGSRGAAFSAALTLARLPGVAQVAGGFVRAGLAARRIGAAGADSARQAPQGMG